MINLRIFTFKILLGLSLLFKAQAFASWSSLEHQGSSVHLYTPASLSHLKPQQKPSFMVNLHGCAQKAQILKDNGNWEAAAEKFQTIVVIPEVPNGGVIARCWDYYGLNHTRENRHNGFILSLVGKVSNLYNVDPHKVYISGLSSGAGLSMVLGCLAPDVFAGIGLNAGPSVGTRSTDVSRSRLDIEGIKKNCLQLAGAQSQTLGSQVISAVFGDNDFIVDPNYNRKNIQALSEILQATDEEVLDVSALKGTRTEGKGTLYLKRGKPVLSIIENTGLGHNWPAGKGGRPASFVSQNSIDYPHYLLQFFTSNNRRP